MTCEQTVGHVYDLLLELLEPQVRSEVEEHLQACAACGQELEKARKALKVVEEWQPTPPAAVMARGLTTRRALPRPASPPWVAGLAAVAAVLALVALVAVSQARRRPADAELLGQGGAKVEVPANPPESPERPIERPQPQPPKLENPAVPPGVATPPSPVGGAPRSPDPAPRAEDPVPPPLDVKKTPEQPAAPKPEVIAKTTTVAVARVERVRGDVRGFTAAQGERRLSEGLDLSPGERLVGLDKDSLISLRFPDSIQLRLVGAAQLRAAADEVVLTQGVLEVEAPKRDKGRDLIVATSNATIESAEGRFTLEKKDDVTLLQVRQGTVQFTNLVTGKVFQAKPGQNAKAEGHPKVDQRKIDAAVASGVAYLRTRLAGLRGGSDELELVLWTLLHAGVPESDRDVQELLKNMLALEPQKTYNTALRAMILEKLGRVRFQEEIWKCAQYLVDNQGANGQWGYGEPTQYGPMPKGVPTGVRPDTATGVKKAVDFSADRKVTLRIPVVKKRDGNPTDNSNSQYAALGLRACHDAGIDLPKEVVEKARKWLVDAQLKEEGAAADKGSVASGAGTAPPRGWHYSPSGTPYGSMTAGAIGSICIYDYILDGEKNLSWKRDKSVLSGLEWLARNFSPTGNPGVDKAVGASYSLIPDGAMYYYYLYAVERTGLLFGTERFGGREWYPEGAAVLLKSQQADGSWPAADTHRRQVWDTSFAILFLRRATRPLQDVASEDKGKKPAGAEK